MLQSAERTDREIGVVEVDVDTLSQPDVTLVTLQVPDDVTCVGVDQLEIDDQVVDRGAVHLVVELNADVTDIMQCLRCEPSQYSYDFENTNNSAFCKF